MKKLGQIGFFKACEVFRTHYEELTRTCRTQQQAVAFISAKLGERLPNSTFVDVLQATGLAFQSHHPLKESASSNKRVIVRAIIALYEEMGVALPNDLKELYQRTFNSPYKPPVPVAQLPKPSQLSIVQ